MPGAIDNYSQGVQSNPLLSLFNNGYSSSPLVQAFGQAYGLNIPGSSPGTAATASQGNRTVGVPGAQGSAGQMPAGGTAAAGQGSILPDNPYSLTQPQQIELNTQLNTLNQAQQQATSAYQASFAQRGGSDPEQMAAGVAAIQEQYAALAEQTSGAFAQNALVQRQTGLGDLMNGGQAAETASNAGNLNVADLLASLGGAGTSQIGQAAGGFGALGGAAQNQANQQQQQSNSDMGSVLNLLGTIATGGVSNLFGGGGVGSGSFPTTVSTGSVTGV